MEHPQIIHKKRSFLSTLALGVSLCVITVTLSGSAIVLYFMYIADHKTDDLVELVENVVKELPEIQRSLPPVLADVLSDRRKPDYRDQLEVTAKLVRSRHRDDDIRPVIKVVNRGEELVSLLSMRVVALRNGEPVAEWNEWAATPIAADPGWRGPLLPDAERHFTSRSLWTGREVGFEELDVMVEITDIRVWSGDRTTRELEL